MSFWSRSWKVLTGLGGAVQAPFGYVKDFTTAPFVDDEELDGFLNVVVGRLGHRGTQAIENLFGPEEGLGAAVGGLPEDFRAGAGQRLGGAAVAGAGGAALGAAVGGPIGALIGGVGAGIYGGIRGFEGVNEDAEFIAREGVFEPLSTAITVGSLAEAPGGGGVGGLFRAEHWREGYRISQDRSWGQALMLAFLTDDITDDAEVTRAAGTDAYRNLSGLADAIGRLRIDPSVLAGRAAVGSRLGTTRAAAKAGTETPSVGRALLSGGIGGAVEAAGARASTALGFDYIRPVTTAQRAKAAAFDARVNSALERMSGMSSAQIRERFFPSHPHGAIIAAALADAPGSTRTIRRFDDPVPEGHVRMWRGESTTRLPEGHVARTAFDGNRGLSGRWFSIDDPVAGKAQDIAENYAKKAAKAHGGDPLVTFVDVPESKMPSLLASLEEPGASVAWQRMVSREVADQQRQGYVVSALGKKPVSFDPLSGRVLRGDVDLEALAARQQVFKAMVDPDELPRLYEARADIAGRLDRLVGEQEAANRLTRAGFELPQGMKKDMRVRVDAELDSLYGDKTQIDRLILAQEKGAVRDLKFASWQAKAGQTMRDDLPRSTFFQESTAAAPLRVARHLGQMRPGPFVNFHAPDGDITLKRIFDRAPISPDVADALRSRYVEALTPPQRQQVWDEAIDEVVTSYAKKAGMSADELDNFVQESRRLRHQQTQEVSQSRAYDAKGRGVMEHLDEDGSVHRVPLPLWLTQEANFGTVPNLDLLDRAVSRVGRFRERHPKADLPEEFLENFHKVWKPAALFRIGWPLRVVGEEQMRILAKIGAAAQAGRVLRDAKEWTLGASSGGRDVSGMAQLFPKALKEAVTDESLGPIRAGRKAWGDAKERAGLGWYEVNGHRVATARGNPVDGQDINAELVRQTANLNSRLYGIEDKLLDDMRRQTGDWRTLTPDATDYAPFWEQAVNRQIGKDAVGRKFLEGAEVDDVIGWLNNDDLGRAYRDRSALYRGAQVRGHSLEEVVAWQKGQVDDLTLGSSDIRAKALAGDASIDDLVKLEPDAARRPPVHGGTVQEGFGGGAWSRTINQTASKVYRALGGYPSTVLSRNRLFNHMYDAEVDRLTRIHKGSLTDESMAGIQKGAREYALSEVRKTLFDLAEDSNLAHMLRFVSPFFMAQQEVVTRWAGLAAQNPAFVAQMRQVWQAPEKAGLVVDENGNRINANGTATSVLTGETIEAGEDRYITLALPEWADDFPGAALLENSRFNKEGLNVAMQMASGIGTGPIVQAPVNELIKERPDLEASVAFILPFGSTQNTMNLILPSTARRIKTQAQGEDDMDFAKSVIRLYYDEVVKFNLGERDSEPTYQEAVKKAREFWSMRTTANAVMPVAPWFVSPYQPYIDAYRNAQTKYIENDQALGGQTPDEWFLDQFGDDYFALTRSVSKTTDGVPPTVEGFLARKKYRDKIEAFPELGRLIIGEEGAGDFSRAVYEHQQSTPLFPGSDENQRTVKTFQEAQAAPDVSLGWQRFGKVMDLIEAAMFQRGVFSLNAAANQDLAAYKKAKVAELAEEFPAWAAEYQDFDPLKREKKLAGLRAIATDAQLQGRPEIQGLSDYFRLRDQFAAWLSAREAQGGASTLQAQSNSDLRFMWEAMVNKLSERNVAFADLRHRWLANDLPASRDVPMAEAA